MLTMQSHQVKPGGERYSAMDRHTPCALGDTQTSRPSVEFRTHDCWNVSRSVDTAYGGGRVLQLILGAATHMYRTYRRCGTTYSPFRDPSHFSESPTLPFTVVAGRPGASQHEFVRRPASSRTLRPPWQSLDRSYSGRISPGSDPCGR